MKMLDLERFFELAWIRYIRLAPDAERINSLLIGRGETIINDHIAFRTFNIKGIDRESLGKVFVDHEYKACEDLEFTEKHLRATYYLHPNPSMPKIFISELLLEKVPDELSDWVKSICRIPEKELSLDYFLIPSWGPIQFEDYSRFLNVSEYAVWAAAFGIQANHFTVFVNALKGFKSLDDLNDYLLSNGVHLNRSGGIKKGTRSDCLEQSSTMAALVEWEFKGNQIHKIMGCYYEFAQRYERPEGGLFQGFIPKSANYIFESTFTKGQHG